MGDRYASDISRLDRISNGNIDYHEDKMYMTLGNMISNKLEYRVLDNFNQIISSQTYSGLLGVVLFRLKILVHKYQLLQLLGQQVLLFKRVLFVLIIMVFKGQKVLSHQ